MGDSRLILGVVGGSLLLLVLAALGMGRLMDGQAGSAGRVEEIRGERRLVMGAEDAKVEVVEFSDFQCPACKAARGLMEQLKTKEGVRLVFKHMPLSNIHKNAQLAAEAAEAANEQGKFWEYHELLFARQEEWAAEAEVKGRLVVYAGELGLDKERFAAALEDRRHREAVTNDYQEALRLRVRGVPTFFVNGRETNAAGLMGLVEEELSL